MRNSALPSAREFQRQPVLQLVLGAVGAAAFCVYARSWKDLPHLIYDVPASLAVYSFIAQLLLELIRNGPSRFWAARFVLLAAMTVVTFGREFYGWDISGHLSCVLAVAVTQAADPRLAAAERLAYCVPLPIVLAIRWTIFDRGQHWQTYNALIFAAVATLPVILLARSDPSR